MSEGSAISIQELVVDYGTRRALGPVSFDVAPREVFALLGPNGGGKTTLFRVLTTAFPATGGRAEIRGHDVMRAPDAVRRELGVVFQSPSLDAKLSVRENLWHAGHLYGLSGRALATRIDEVLALVTLSDRGADTVEHLSGGQRRRVELAKGLLHRPALLLLDEPSTGLDPGARRDLWRQLLELRDQTGVTILLTTHILDEAERCDRVGILDRGRLVALDSPAALKRSIRGEVVTVEGDEPVTLRERILARFGGEATVLHNSIRIERPDGAAFVAELMRAFPDDIRAVTVGQPTLEDVFIHVTGRGLWETEQAAAQEGSA
ncbi:MAG: ATP-binding cassette domain-containing protein [Deltaproteobacteria bacterium]|nr:ATP-binding cassette domain-containing protein [Deltaproteobacteria bacterium]